MNERIRELAEQAGGYVSLSHEHDGKFILSGNTAVQKFAELIVRECGKVADDHTFDCEGVTFDLEELLVNHFGIK